MGLEFARQLAARGYDLVLVSNQEQALADAARELSGPVSVRTRFQDLAQERSADGLVAWCDAQSLVPDVIVNDAGMFFFKELQAEDLDRVQAMIHLHITTITRLCLLFGARMKERGSGYILNVSSMAARLPVPGITVYSATKAYLRSFGRSLSYEMEPHGVGVTTVCPAAIATPLYKLDEKWMRIGVRTRFIHTPEWLVRRSLRAMFHRRRLIQPSSMNVWLPALIALLPGPVISRIWEKYKA